MEAQTGWLRQGLGSRRKSSVWVPLTLVVRRCFCVSEARFRLRVFHRCSEDRAPSAARFF